MADTKQQQRQRRAWAQRLAPGAGLLLLTDVPSYASAFHPPPSSFATLADAHHRTDQSSRLTFPTFAAAAASNPTSSNADAFDFSSKSGWDDFYSGRSSTNDDCVDSIDGIGETFEPYEWHSTLPHSTIFDALPPSAAGGSVLMVGCGTSTMPMNLYNLHKGKTRVICLDYSPTCIDQLRESWGDKDDDNLHFVCGDATQLENVPLIDESQFNSDNQSYLDAVIDKGLIDCLMTGEGWDGDVDRLLRGAAKLLRSGGQYLLVSYQLTSSTKGFLVETGNEIGFQWEFDLIEGEIDGRVSFSKAVKIAYS